MSAGGFSAQNFYFSNAISAACVRQVGFALVHKTSHFYNVRQAWDALTIEFGVPNLNNLDTLF